MYYSIYLIIYKHGRHFLLYSGNQRVNWAAINLLVFLLKEIGATGLLVLPAVKITASKISLNFFSNSSEKNGI